MITTVNIAQSIYDFKLVSLVLYMIFTQLKSYYNFKQYAQYKILVFYNYKVNRFFK